MSEDELRKRILARRARFVAASLAVGAVALDACSANPKGCLFPPDAGRPEDASSPWLDFDGSSLDFPDGTAVQDADLAEASDGSAADAGTDAGSDATSD